MAEHREWAGSTGGFSGYRCAAYLRRSTKEDGAAESFSITTQRGIIHNFAGERGIQITAEYVDDGWTGTNFDRPAFRRMMDDIDAGRINMVITKDLSRLGREYIQTGQYTELIFPQKGVRYIAINDGYDSDSLHTDIAPFKNIINEMYARDTSRKIKSAFLTLMLEGKFIGPHAPFGYKKDAQDKHRLVPDEPAAAVVREMFALAEAGVGAGEIARRLNSRGVSTPLEYRGGAGEPGGGWTHRKVNNILGNRVYLGCVEQHKTSKVSFKSPVTVNHSPEQWIVVENTHQPLVAREVFDVVRARMRSRVSPPAGRFRNVFSGVARCADCGRGMSTTAPRRHGAARLACGRYKLYGAKQCSNHFVDYQVLCRVVLEALRGQMERLSPADRAEILAELAPEPGCQGSESVTGALRARAAQLDSVVERLYADRLEGVLSEERFRKLLTKYEAESEEIARRLTDTEANREMQWEDLMRQEAARLEERLAYYTGCTELTAELLNLFVSRIEVGQGVFVQSPRGRVKRQQIHIYFRFACDASSTLEYEF